MSTISDLKSVVNPDGTYSLSDLQAYLDNKAINHNRYKIYTKKDYLDSWRRNDCLFLTDGSKWNDCLDSKRFMRSDSVKRFGLCMSYSLSENVAMWMLYGGNARNGALLNMQQGDFIEISNDLNEATLGFWGKGDNFKELGTLSSDQFKVHIRDILYVGNTIDTEKTTKIKQVTESKGQMSMY